MKGGEHGAALVPGSAEKSKLYRMVAGLDEPAMPMEGEALKPAEITAIKTWIDQGANWDAPAATASPAPAASQPCRAERLCARHSTDHAAHVLELSRRDGPGVETRFAHARRRVARRSARSRNHSRATRRGAGCIDSSPVSSRSPCRSSFRS